MKYTPTAIRPRHHQAKKCCSGRHLGSAVVFLLVLYAGLLAWIGLNISPVRDEVGHLPAGVYAWQFGRFDLYRAKLTVYEEEGHDIAKMTYAKAELWDWLLAQRRKIDCCLSGCSGDIPQEERVSLVTQALDGFREGALGM